MCDLYIYNFIYLYNVDVIREGHPADLMNYFLTWVVSTCMFIYLHLTCYKQPFVPIEQFKYLNIFN